MLAQTLVLIVLLALFGASAVSGVAGVARTQSANAAHALIAPAVASALARYQREIGAAIAAQQPPASDAAVVPPAGIAALRSGAWPERTYRETPAGGPFAVAVSVRPTAATVPVCAQPDGGPDVAVALQCSAFVQETRLSLTIVADAGPADAGGSVSSLAHDRATVTLRLFARAPYSAVSGYRVAADPNGAHEGDDGGFGYALPAFGTPASGDTTIHVVFACAPGTGACTAGDPPSPDRPEAIPWTNGNAER